MITEILSELKINAMRSEEQYKKQEKAGNINKSEIYLVPDEGIDLTDYATTEYVDSTKTVVTDTYSSTSSAAMSGKAVASAINNKFLCLNSKEPVPDNLPEGTIVFIYEE